MAVLCRWILLLTLLLAAGPQLCGASQADRDYDAAVKAFQDSFYARAEAQFGTFCQKYPASPRLPEAILLQARARIGLTNFAGAVELLNANQAKAGTNADQYLFWLGEAHSRAGEWRAATDSFSKLVGEHPASPMCLEATVRDAAARSALAQTEPAEWQRVIGMLQQTNGVFQEAARTNSASDLVPRGRLLLSEALLATKDYRGAEETLQPLAKRLLNPKLGWQWQYLLCRIYLADGRTNAALEGATNLLAIAANGALTNLLAESAAFQADLFERLGRTSEAVAAYERNLPAGMPAERQRQALLKITGLSLAQNNIRHATETLEKFVKQYPDAASADLALLSLGELRLRQYGADLGPGAISPALTNAPPGTNPVQVAAEPLETLVKQHPQSPFVGKAQLDLGWCYLREGKLPEAQAAFQAAVDHLTYSEDLANAYFRLADAQFQRSNYASAVQNYQAVIAKFESVPAVRTNLFEPALYQTVRAGLKGGDLGSVTNALQKLRAWYPRSLSTAHAVLLTASDFTRRGDSPTARKILVDFDTTIPDAPLRAERQLAVAATWEKESNWSEAISEYNRWLGTITNLDVRARAEYNRAHDTFLAAGATTNALALFTAYVTTYPTNELTPFAQMWVADYYYNLGDYVAAERNYKALFQNTNWPPSALTYEAQYKAGQAAVKRQGWPEARKYLTTLYNNTNGPTIHLRFQALLEHGRALMQYTDPEDTNKLANCKEAIGVFGLICDLYPTNGIAARAWLEKGSALLQWALARQQYDSLTNALNAYQQAIDSPQADVSARSEAKVGQAVTLTKWAAQKTGKEQTALLEQALSNCVDVVYGTILRENEQPDLLWTKEAGLKGVDLADSLQAWAQEVRLFQRLTNSVWPQLPASLVKQAAKAQENLDRQKADP